MSEPTPGNAFTASATPRRVTGLVLVLVATWLLWSGVYKPLIVGLGALSVALVTLVAVRIRFFDPDAYSLYVFRRLPGFAAWLLVEMVKANLVVARRVLAPTLPIAPRIVTVDAAHLPEVGQAILANAITLTPGTLATDIHEGRIEVHCLAEATADDLAGGEMLRRVEHLLGRT